MRNQSFISVHPDWEISLAKLPTPNDQDVLFGRGNSVNFHPGNKHFRSLVAQAKPDWRAAAKFDRPKIANKIVSMIRFMDPPGRFLKFDRAENLWCEVSYSQALDKTKKALREGNVGLPKDGERKRKNEAGDKDGANADFDDMNAYWVEAFSGARLDFTNNSLKSENNEPVNKQRRISRPAVDTTATDGSKEAKELHDFLDIYNVEEDPLLDKENENDWREIPLFVKI